MPTYDFKCDVCDITYTVKMSFEEHEKLKNQTYCLCGRQCYQVVAPLNFKLKGEGWFGNNADAVASPYAITQMEINKNLELEKKVEDVANNFSEKESN